LSGFDETVVKCALGALEMLRASVPQVTVSRVIDMF
jgi:hypothetical protein